MSYANRLMITATTANPARTSATIAFGSEKSNSGSGRFGLGVLSLKAQAATRNHSMFGIPDLPSINCILPQALARRGMGK
ncbi:MAG: hypothetical protein FWG02_05965 [Holophagaceae bacterium]|nr:hypothetical protein [Holophagaceae bacterium]